MNKRKTYITSTICGALFGIAISYNTFFSQNLPLRNDVSENIETTIRNNISQNTTPASSLHVGPFDSPEEFFSLSDSEFIAYMLLKEDDTFKTTEDVASVTFQKAYEYNLSPREVLESGKYSGVKRNTNQVKNRILNNTYTEEQVTKAHTIALEYLSKEGPFRSDGADKFTHVDFPHNLSETEILRNINSDPHFAKEHGLPSYYYQNTVDIKRFSGNRYMIMADVE